LLSQALPGQVVVDEAIENGIGEGGISDDFKPAVDRV
jgi:hypothetical protein